MTSFGLYRPGASPLHRLHPLTSLTLTLAGLAIVFGGPGGWIPAFVIGLLALAVLSSAGLGRRSLRTWLRLLPLTLILFGVHGFFSPVNRTILASLGPFHLGQEGLAYAGLISLRLSAALLTSFILVMTVHPARLVQALEEAGLPRGLAYLIGSPLLLLPQLAGRVQAIRAAQQARGLETEGNFFQRARALFPLAAPLIFGALVDVEERSLALEARGFSAPGRKTALVELPDSPRQRRLRRGMIVLTVGLLAWGAWERLHGAA